MRRPYHAPDLRGHPGTGQIAGGVVLAGIALLIVGVLQRDLTLIALGLILPLLAVAGVSDPPRWLWARRRLETGGGGSFPGRPRELAVARACTEGGDEILARARVEALLRAHRGTLLRLAHRWSTSAAGLGPDFLVFCHSSPVA